MPVQVKVDTKELERAFKKIKKKIPAVTAKSMNETAAWARGGRGNNATKQTAAELNVAQKFIKTRFSADGSKKGPRSTIKKAKKSSLRANIEVYVRGIPVGQIAGKPTKGQRKRPGVKATGGRFYKGAFYAPGGAPHGYVFKRRRSGQLMMPKVGVRKTIDKNFSAWFMGRQGQAELKRRWERLAQFELSKIQA